jgi:redox-sensing transcriptional repressor
MGEPSRRARLRPRELVVYTRARCGVCRMAEARVHREIRLTLPWRRPSVRLVDVDADPDGEGSRRAVRRARPGRRPRRRRAERAGARPRGRAPRAGAGDEACDDGGRAVTERAIPPATVARLPAYRRVLMDAADAGQRTIASGAIAEAVGVHPDQVRKDLSHLATRGTRGVGYDVRALIAETSAILGLDEERTVVLVGVGNLGRALAAYEGFAPQGFRLVAVLDVDDAVIGSGGRRPARRAPRHAAGHRSSRAGRDGRRRRAGPAAQAVVDAMVAAGLRTVLNFAPVHVRVPSDVAVRRVDLSTELQMLSFLRSRMRRDG